MQLSAGYDDNVNLVAPAQEKISSADVMLDARADFIARELNWLWRVTPEVNGAVYPSHTSLDSNGEFLYLYGERNGPRYTVELNGYAWSQTLLRNYLPTSGLTTGLGVAEQGTTISSISDTRQNLGFIDPKYTLQVTQRQRIELEANYTDSTYNRQIEGGYTDYSNVAGAAGWVFQATPTGSLTLRGRGQQFKPDFGLSTETFGGELQWDGKLSANKLYYLRVGAERSTFSGSVVPAPGEAPISDVPGVTSVTGGAGAQWSWQVTELFLDALRDVEGTGAGYAVARAQLRLRLERRFTERLAGFISVRTIYDDPVNDAVLPNTARPSHYNYGSTGLEWRFTREFTLTGAYEYTGFRGAGSTTIVSVAGGTSVAQAVANSGSSNAVRLSVIWEPNRPANGPAITVGY